MKNKIKSLVRHLLFWGYYICSMVAIPVVYNRSYNGGELSYLPREDFEVWKKSMLDMLKEYCSAGYNFRIRKVIYTFANAKIEVVRKTKSCSKDKPIVVLSIKNDYKRIQMLVEYYRKLGIEKFAFMDNGSDDGTFEWLMEQKDIDLYRCFEPYQTAVKEGWINRVISYYGFDRWYIVTDSDELITYVGIEKYKISDVIEFAKKNRIERIKGLTIDMYSDGELFGESENIYKDYCWMDIDGYYERENRAGRTKFKTMFGGPRYRLMKSTITLSKYPLVYFEKGTISDSAHFQYPHDKLPDYKCYFGILHYKFIEKDLEVYKQRANKESGFSTGGLIYKQYLDYIEKTNGSNMKYPGSRKYTSSESIKDISLIKEIQFGSLEE